MSLEVARLLLGLLIAALHRPIADFIFEREHSLVLAFRERGIACHRRSQETFRTIYFSIGIFMALIIVRIHQMLRIYISWPAGSPVAGTLLPYRPQI